MRTVEGSNHFVMLTKNKVFTTPKGDESLGVDVYQNNLLFSVQIRNAVLTDVSAIPGVYSYL